MNSATDRPLDQTDRKILAELAQNGRISVAELSRRVNLSKTPCQARIHRLEQDGFILGYRAVIDPTRLGLPHVAFVEVRLSDTRKAALEAFNKAVRALPEVEQAHMIASITCSRCAPRTLPPIAKCWAKRSPPCPTSPTPPPMSPWKRSRTTRSSLRNRLRGLSPPGRRAGRLYDGAGIDVEMAIEVIDRAGLAEMLHPQRHGAMTEHAA